MKKQELLNIMVDEMPYKLADEIKPYILELMDIYAKSECINFGKEMMKKLTGLDIDESIVIQYNSYKFKAK